MIIKFIICISIIFIAIMGIIDIYREETRILIIPKINQNIILEIQIRITFIYFTVDKIYTDKNDLETYIKLYKTDFPNGKIKFKYK